MNRSENNQKNFFWPEDTNIFPDKIFFLTLPQLLDMKLAYEMKLKSLRGYFANLDSTVGQKFDSELEKTELEYVTILKAIKRKKETTI